ncbi:hypothetical protein DKG77_04035 [Flagellimonas aquimarina]|uniref:Uncharacterized protein n=1 Tax=Flagellimonas aquimarina TaxID=2201895 RepID=A0A316L2E9_9FLAO|nr:hypothetical protein [Allomuricauda koreensis]PWL40006.1 hypothetical protein DKG77_04035 [Allomuricauda koreensis]
MRSIECKSKNKDEPMSKLVRNAMLVIVLFTELSCSNDDLPATADSAYLNYETKTELELFSFARKTSFRLCLVLSDTDWFISVLLQPLQKVFLKKYRIQ